MTAEAFFGLFNYWIVICLMMTGFYIVISSGNLIKTVIGLNIFQTSVFLLYITMGKITDATRRVTAPILEGGHGSCLLYTSPSPRDKRQSRMPSSA